MRQLILTGVVVTALGGYTATSGLVTSGLAQGMKVSSPRRSYRRRVLDGRRSSPLSQRRGRRVRVGSPVGPSQRL